MFSSTYHTTFLNKCKDVTINLDTGPRLGESRVQDKLFINAALDHIYTDAFQHY